MNRGAEAASCQRRSGNSRTQRGRRDALPLALRLARRALADLAEVRVRVEPGRVAVAPEEPERVVADRLRSLGAHVGGDVLLPEDPRAGRLVHAARAAAREAQR